MNYGYWKGSQIVSQTEQQLYYKSSNNEITLTPDDASTFNGSLSYIIKAKHFSEFYHQKVNYTAHVIWKFGNENQRKETCDSGKDLDVSRWMCENGVEIHHEKVCDGYKDCNDTTDSDESAKVCSIAFPLNYLAAVLGYILVGLLCYAAFKLLDKLLTRCLEKPQKEMNVERGVCMSLLQKKFDLNFTMKFLKKKDLLLYY